MHKERIKKLIDTLKLNPIVAYYWIRTVVNYDNIGARMWPTVVDRYDGGIRNEETENIAINLNFEI